MLTQKELMLKSNNFLDNSQTYVYFPRGLSHEFEEMQISQSIPNYRSAFFENDKDLENYHKQLKEALYV